MKGLFLPLLLILGMLSNAALAQVKFSLKEENRSMSGGSFNALVLELPTSSAKDVGNAWKDFMKKFKGKTKYDKKNKEYFTDNTKIKGVSDENNTIDVYAKVEDRGDAGCEIAVWFNLGGAYLSQKEHADRFKSAEKTLEKFTNKLSSDLLEDQLKEEEKKMKNLEKDFKDLEKDQKKREKDIRDYKDTIEKMKNEIKKGEADVKEILESQGNKKKEMEAQGKVLDELKKKIKAMK